MKGIKLSPIAERAKKSLENCSIIRTCFDHDGFLELFELGIADFTNVDGNDNALDWVLR